jgi:hypothetical protein
MATVRTSGGRGSVMSGSQVVCSSRNYMAVSWMDE